MNTKHRSYSGPIFMILVSFWRKWPRWELPGFFSYVSLSERLRGMINLTQWFWWHGIFIKSIFLKIFHKNTLLHENTPQHLKFLSEKTLRVFFVLDQTLLIMSWYVQLMFLWKYNLLWNEPWESTVGHFEGPPCI